MLQYFRRCSARGRSSKTNSNYQKIGLALVCTVFAFVTPMSDAFAVSKEEQRRCLEYANNYADKLNVQLDQRSRQAIRHYCLKGDTRTAQRIVAARAEASADRRGGAPADDARSCLREVREYAARLNVRLGGGTAERVEAHCRRGDTRSAMRVVASYAKASAGRKSKAPANDSESCLADVRQYAAKLNVRLDRNAANKISGYCRRGDTRSALRVVQSQAKGSRRS